MHPFFPDPAFGWAFCLALLAFLAVAAYLDWRTTIVPKKLTLSLLPLGLLFNLCRGASLGANGLDVWAFGAHGAPLGILDGFLFSLAGFALGFALFFLLWVLGTCGGGDVKLFAALGAWVGPGLAVRVLIVTLVLVALVALLHVARQITQGRLPAIRARKACGKMRPRMLTYSLPLALAVTFVLLWSARFELRLAVPAPEKETAHVSR